MSKFREKAEAQTEQVIGQMLGDELLVKEGQERSRKVEAESGPSEDQATGADRSSRKTKPARKRSAGSTREAIRQARKSRRARRTISCRVIAA